MEKKIEDYIYMYIGCQAQTEDGIGRLNSFNHESGGCEIIFGITGPDFSKTYFADQVKIVLRPLSDMTEEEMQECGNMIYDFSDEPDLNKWKPSDFEIGLAPEQFHWLLKKSFDLFGLIESGLAIDKSSLK